MKPRPTPWAFALLLMLALWPVAHAAQTVEIIEYSDFQCPYCHRAQPTIDQVMAKYGDQVKWEYRHFPLDFHAAALPAAAISECARDQGKFKEVHSAFFSMNPQTMSETSVMTAAKAKVPNPDALEACYKSGKKQELVLAQQKEGQARGVSGTPGFFINGKMLSGAQPFEVFDRMISVALDPSKGVPLYVITPPGCPTCVPEEMLNELTGQVLQGAVRQDVPYESAKGRALMGQAQAKALPVVLLGKDLEQEPGFRQIARYVSRKGELYQLSPTLAPPTLFLEPLPAYSFDLFIGPKGAPVTIVEYTDFVSDRASAVSRAVIEVIQKYPGKIRHIVRPAAAGAQALDQSRLVGQAAFCLSQQGKFWKGYPLLSLAGPKANQADLERLAADTGAKVPAFRECLKQRDMFSNRVKAYGQDMTTLTLQPGVNLFVGRQRLMNPSLFDLYRTVEGLLKAKKKPKDG